MTGRPVPAAPPVNVVLEAVFEVMGPDSWRADPERLGRWHAACPVCREWRTLTIVEHGGGGPVTLRCAGGCHEERIEQALSRPVDDSAPGLADDPVQDGLVAMAGVALGELGRLRELVAALRVENAELRTEIATLRPASELREAA